jgi:hypothetical protein
MCRSQFNCINGLAIYIHNLTSASHTKFTDSTSFDFVPYNVSYIVSMISELELGAMHFLALAASYLGEIVVRL